MTYLLIFCAIAMFLTGTAISTAAIHNFINPKASIASAILAILIASGLLTLGFYLLAVAV